MHDKYHLTFEDAEIPVEKMKKNLEKTENEIKVKIDHKEEIKKIMEIIEDATDGFLIGSTCNAITNLLCWNSVRAEIDKNDFMESLSRTWEHHQKIYEDRKHDRNRS